MQSGYVAGSYVIYKKSDGSITTQTVPLAGNDMYTVNSSIDICMFYANLDNVTFFRISGYTGSNAPIVTKNEEIPW